MESDAGGCGLTVCADVHLAEVHVVGRGKLHGHVVGVQLPAFAFALEADRSTCRHGARILTTPAVVVVNRQDLCGMVARQTDDEIVRPVSCKCKQEGQHPLTGQRAPPISGGTYRRRRTLIDGYLESPFPTACLL